MKLKGIVDSDISNYKKISMFVITNTCSLKCDKENGNNYCQNSGLLSSPDIEISADELYERYVKSKLSEALVIGGLEPFDSIADLLEIMVTFRGVHKCTDDIVIYTGYRKEEISSELFILRDYKPFIVKFGRYRPNQKPHFDEILGVELANDEQYAEYIGNQDYVDDR